MTTSVDITTILIQSDKLTAAATPGLEESDCDIPRGTVLLQDDERTVGYWMRRGDAEFLVHAHTALPALVEEVRRLQELTDSTKYVVRTIHPSRRRQG